jgi:dTDP-D-glucose 4,6-dehydratase
MLQITGGSGFIGSDFVLDWLAQSDESFINFDAFAYVGNLDNFVCTKSNSGNFFGYRNVGIFELVLILLAKHRPRAEINFITESDVDRSIHGPNFIPTDLMTAPFIYLTQCVLTGADLKPKPKPKPKPIYASSRFTLKKSTVHSP